MADETTAEQQLDTSELIGQLKRARNESIIGKLNGIMPFEIVPKRARRMFACKPDEFVRSSRLASNLRRYCVGICETFVPTKGRAVFRALIADDVDKQRSQFEENFDLMLAGKCKVYLTTSCSTIRAVELATLCGACSRSRVNQLLSAAYKLRLSECPEEPSLTPFVHIGWRRYLSAVTLEGVLTATGHLPLKSYASRLTREAAFDMLRWIHLNCPIGWKPGIITRFSLGGVEYQMPVLARIGDVKEMWTAYKLAHKALGNVSSPRKWTPGEGTFKTFLRYITRQIHSRSCLSYYYLKMLDTFATWIKLVQHMERLYDTCLDMKEGSADRDRLVKALPSRKHFKSKQRELKEVCRYAKSTLRSHMVLEHPPNTDGSHDADVAVHCVRLGLSGCDHQHTGSCASCEKYWRVGWDVKRFIQVWTNNFCRAMEGDHPEWRHRPSVFADDGTTGKEISTPASVSPVPPPEFNADDWRIAPLETTQAGRQAFFYYNVKRARGNKYPQICGSTDHNKLPIACKRTNRPYLYFGPTCILAMSLQHGCWRRVGGEILL
jgi:hypothetical protein